jgi:ribosomal protein S20
MEDYAYKTIREMIRRQVANSSRKTRLRKILEESFRLENIIKASPERLAKLVLEIMSTKVLTCIPKTG